MRGRTMKSFNLELVNLIQNNISIKYNLERLYFNNLKFIKMVIKDCNVTDSELEKELLQIAFFAVYDAAIKFDFSRSDNYLYYLHRWLIHYFYQDLLRMRYSFRITDSAYREAKRLGDLSTFRAVDLSYLSSSDVALGISNGSLVTYLHIEDRFRSDLSKEIWKIVRKNISEMNYQILIYRFVYQMSYKQIGDLYNIGKERIRLRVLRSLNRLKCVIELQIIAKDWYNIRIDPKLY